MSKQYNLTYHLATNVSVTVESVDADNVIDVIPKALEDDTKVIVVEGRDTKLTQYIPVRHILVVEAEEVS